MLVSQRIRRLPTNYHYQLILTVHLLLYLFTSTPIRMQAFVLLFHSHFLISWYHFLICFQWFPASVLIVNKYNNRKVLNSFRDKHRPSVYENAWRIIRLKIFKKRSKKDLNKDHDYIGKVAYLNQANIKKKRSALFKFEFQAKKIVASRSKS